MLTLEIYRHTRADIPEEIFQKLLQPAQKRLEKERRIRRSQNFFLELSLVGDKRITGLNQKFHHKNRPTDVISLSYFDPREERDFAGEIFISVPYARRQARKIGQPLSEELKFLFIHGLLHIFGYDHKKPRDEVQMNGLAYAILGRENKKVWRSENV